MGFSKMSIWGLSKTWYKVLSGVSRYVQNLLGFLGKEQGCRKGGIRVGWGSTYKGKQKGKGIKAAPLDVGITREGHSWGEG